MLKIKIIFIVLLSILLYYCSAKKNESGKIAIIFFKSEVNDNYRLINEIAQQLRAKYYPLKIKTEGLPVEALIIEISREYLLRYDLEYDNIINALKSEFTDSLAFTPNYEKLIISFKLADIRKLEKFNPQNISDIIISKKGTGPNLRFVRLGDVALVKVGFIPDDSYYKGRVVYKIICSYNYKYHKEFMIDLHNLKNQYSINFQIDKIDE